MRWVDADPFWVWHFANAFDNPDGSVTVDYVEWTYPGGFADQPTPASSSLTRAVIGPDAGITRTVLSNTEPNMEFPPRVDDRLLTREHHRIASVAKGPRDSGDLDSLWFHDLAAGTEKVWTPGAAIGEPIHIPGAERDYWGCDRHRSDRHDLAVLPAHRRRPRRTARSPPWTYRSACPRDSTGRGCRTFVTPSASSGGSSGSGWVAA